MFLWRLIKIFKCQDWSVLRFLRKKQPKKRVKKAKKGQKMSLCDLFDMEWGYAEKEEVEIDASFLFEKMERELKEYLLEQELEGDSTDGLLTS